MGSRTLHMCLSVRGALRMDRRRLRQLAKSTRGPDGRVYTPDGLREALLDELARGREVIPLGECPGFDFKTGCPGHPVAEKERDGE